MAKTMNVNLVFNANTQQVKRELEQLKSSLSGLTNLKAIDPNKLGVKEYNQQLQAATGSLSKLQSILNATTDSSGRLNASQFVQQMNKAGLSVKQIHADMGAFGQEGQKAFQQLAQSVANSQVQVRQTNLYVDKLWASMKNVATWQISSKILYGFMGSISTAYNYAQDLNESLNNIRIVTGYNTDQMAKFAEQANKAAKALSTTTTAYTDASLIYYQQGLKGQDVLDRADITTKLANVARTSAEEASEWMTAIWNNFYDGSKSLEYYADVLTKLGADTASSADEIAGGLEKFSAVSKTVGLSYEYAAGALATITAQTRQSEDVVGTSLKTLFARIQNLSLGDTLEDGTTLAKYSEALKVAGIDIKNTSGELKSMDTILNEMGATWTTLSKDQQLALAQTVGGIRQYNQLVALMDNWDFFEKNVENAKNATGALTEQNEIYAESWEAAKKRVQASAEGLYQSLLKDDFFIEMTDGIADFLTGLDNVIDSMGGLKVLLPSIILLFNKLFGDKMLASIRSFSSNMALSSKSMIAEVNKTKMDFQKMSAIPVSGGNSIVANTIKTTGDQRIALNDEILKIQRSLTAEEQKALEVNTIELENLQNQLIKRAELVKLAEEEQQSVKSKLLQAQTAYAKEIKTSPEYTTAIDVATSAYGPEGQIRAKTVNYAQLFAESSGSIDVFKEKVSSAMKGAGIATEQFDAALETCYAMLEDIATNFTTDKTTQELNEAEAEVDEATQKLQGHNKALQDGQKQYDKLADSAKKYAQSLDTLDWSTALMKTTNTLMSATMAINSWNSATDTFKSPDATSMEKFTSLIMAFTMTAPIVVGLIKTITTLTKAEAGARTLNAIAALFESKATRKQSEEEIKNAIAKKATNEELYKQAWGRLGKAVGSAAKTIGPIAALLAVAAGIYKLLSNEYNKTVNKLKEATEVAKQAKEQAAEMSENYNNFMSTLSSYEDGVNGLKELTAGTEEYNQKLIEVNQNAQELINKYDDLKYHMEDGAIVIDEESLKDAQNRQLQNMSIANANVINTENAVKSAQLDKNKEDYLRYTSKADGADEQDALFGAGGGAIGTAIGTAAVIALTHWWNPGGWAAAIIAGVATIGVVVGASLEDSSAKEQEMLNTLTDTFDTSEKASAATERDIVKVLEKNYSSKEIEAFLGEDSSKIQDLLLNIAQTEEKILEQNKLMVQQYNQGNENYTNLDDYEKVYADTYIARNLPTRIKASYEDVFDYVTSSTKFTKMGTTDDARREVIDKYIEFARKQGRIVSFSGENGAKLEINENGKTEEVSYEALINELLLKTASTVTDEDVNVVEENYADISDRIGDIIADLSKAEASSLIGQIANQQFTDFTMLSQDQINQIKESYSDEFDWSGAEVNRQKYLQKYLDELTYREKSIYNTLDNSNLKATELVAQMQLISKALDFGAEAWLPSVLESAPDRAKAINDLNDIDWSMATVDGLSYQLKDSLDTSSGSWKRFAREMIEAGAAANADIDYFNKLITSIGEIQNAIKDIEVGKVLNNEAYEKLISQNGALAKSFVKVADGWMLIEDASTFSNKALDTYNDNIDVAVEQAQKYKTLGENLKERKINTEATGEDDQRDILQSLKANELSLVLERAGLGGQNLRDLDKADLDAAYKAMADIIFTSKAGGFDQDNTITGLMSRANISEAERAEYIVQAKTQEEYEKFLQSSNALAKQKLDISDDELKALRGTLRAQYDINNAVKNDINLMNTLAIASENINQGAENIVDKYGEWNTLLSSGQYHQALGEAAETVRDMFGVDDSIVNVDFINEYWSQIENITKGGDSAKEAVEQISDAIGKQQAEASGISGELLNYALNSQLAFGQQETKEQINNLNTLIEAQSIDIGELATIYRILGLEIERANGKIVAITGANKAQALNTDRLNKTIKTEIERYHYLNEQLEDHSRVLDEINRKKDKAYGPDRLKYMEAEQQAMKAEIETQKELVKAMEDNLKQDALKLGSNVKLDDYGRIINYDDVYNESTQEAIDQYEETLNGLENAYDTLAQKQLALKEASLEKITFDIEFKIENYDETIAYIEWVQKMLTDDTHDAARSIELIGDQTEAIMGKIKTNRDGLEEIFKDIGLTSEEIDRFMNEQDYTVFDGKTISEDQMDAIKKARDNIMDLTLELQELKNTAGEKIRKAFDGWNDELDKNNEKIERNRRILNDYKNIIDLAGKKSLGVTNELLDSLSQSMISTSLDAVQAAAAKKKMNETALEDAKAKRAAAVTEDEKKLWDETIEHITNSLDDADKELSDSLGNALTEISTQFESTVERTLETLSEALGGVEELTEQFNKQRKIEELYLADHKKIYEINKLNRDIQNSIDNTDNVKAQRELAAIAEEVMAYQEDGVQMSKYDLEYLQKRFDLKKAEIALEEAQNAKNVVKLSRDSKGNWGYIYTANQADVDKAQENYEKALYELQEFSYQSERELTEQILSLEQEMMDELSKLREKDFEDRAAYDAKVKEITDHYMTRIHAATNELQDITRQNLIINKEYGTSMAANFEQTILGGMQPTYKSFEEFTASITTSISNTVATLGTTFTNTKNAVNTALGLAQVDIKNFSDNASKKISEVTKTSKDVATEAENIATKFEEEFPKATEAIDNWYEKWVSDINNLIGENGSHNKLINSINKVIEAYKSLVKAENAANGTSHGMKNPVGTSAFNSQYEKELAEEGYIDFSYDDNKIYTSEITGAKYGYQASTDQWHNITKGRMNEQGQYDISSISKVSVKKDWDDGSGSVYKKSMETGIDLIDTGTGWIQFSDSATNVNSTVEGYANVSDNYVKVEDSGTASDGQLEIKANGKWYKYDTVEDQNFTDNGYVYKYALTEDALSPGGAPYYKDKTKHYIGEKVKVYAGHIHNVYSEPGKWLDFTPYTLGDAQTVEIEQMQNNNGKNYYKLKDITWDVPFTTADYVNPWMDEDSFGNYSFWDTWTKKDKYARMSFDTGGYTGEWGPEGRIAMVHQKEIILNSNDTENFLSAVKIVRSMSDMLEHNARVASYGLQLDRLMSSIINKQPIEQNVHIEAHFPNATDRYEIEEAFNSLMNDASQYVNRY